MEQASLTTIDEAIRHRSSTRESILSLEKSLRYDLSGSQQGVNEQKERLRQTLDSLKHVFETDYERGQNVLTPTLERLLIEGLLCQRQQIKRELDEVKSIWTDEKLEGLSKERLESVIVYVGRRIEGICERITHNASVEEAILKTAKKALEEEVR